MELLSKVSGDVQAVLIKMDLFKNFYEDSQRHIEKLEEEQDLTRLRHKTQEEFHPRIKDPYNPGFNINDTTHPHFLASKIAEQIAFKPATADKISISTAIQEYFSKQSHFPCEQKVAIKRALYQFLAQDAEEVCAEMNEPGLDDYFQTVSEKMLSEAWEKREKLPSVLRRD